MAQGKFGKSKATPAAKKKGKAKAKSARHQMQSGKSSHKHMALKPPKNKRAREFHDAKVAISKAIVKNNESMLAGNAITAGDKPSSGDLRGKGMERSKDAMAAKLAKQGQKREQYRAAQEKIAEINAKNVRETIDVTDTF